MHHKMITKRKSCNKTYVGFCYNKSHRGHITKKVMREKECCSKTRITDDGKVETYTCPFFKPNEGHTYWREKHQADVMRRVKKELKRCAIMIPSLEIKDICKKNEWDAEKAVSFIREKYSESEEKINE